MRHRLAQLSMIAALSSGCAAQVPSAEPALAARGQRLFLRCASCHELSDSGLAKTGPTLKGVIGRRVASVPGYDYSKSLAALSFTWDEARLDEWLQRPTGVVAGTTMAFEGMPEAADRKALIAFLKAPRP